MSLRGAARGRGLIESVAAAMLAAALAAGAFTLYLHNERARRPVATRAAAENALRAALALLEPDLRMAGGYGSSARGEWLAAATPVGLADQDVRNDCAPAFVGDLAHPLEVRARYDLACQAVRPASWSEVLIVRRAAAGPRPREPGRVQLAATALGGRVAASAEDVPGAEFYDLVVHAYYVGEDAPGSGERRFALHRQSLAGGRGGPPRIVDEVVVPGIADLRVRVGLDLDGDGSADVFVPPGAPELARGRVVAVRLALTALATPAPGSRATVARDGPPPDGRERIVVERTVALRNAAGR